MRWHRISRALCLGRNKVKLMALAVTVRCSSCSHDHTSSRCSCSKMGDADAATPLLVVMVVFVCERCARIIY